MQKRILNIYNFVPLILVPSVVWGFDLVIQLFIIIGWIPSAKPWTLISILFLTISLPLCGYLSIAIIYKYFSGKVPNMLPPEIPAIVGFLYAQPIYVILLKLAAEGTGGAYPISFWEAIKAILILTPIVPISTVMLSTYDGTLLAVPLTCLSIILAGHRCKRKKDKESNRTKGKGDGCTSSLIR